METVMFWNPTSKFLFTFKRMLSLIVVHCVGPVDQKWSITILPDLFRTENISPYLVTEKEWIPEL